MAGIADPTLTGFPIQFIELCLGLTKVPLKTYVLVSWLGMIPGTLLYVYLGSIAQNLTALLNGELAESPVGNTLFYLGLAATLALSPAHPIRLGAFDKQL